MSDVSRYADAVGRTAEPRWVDVEAGHVRRFAEAIGDPSPVYYDDAAARAAGLMRATPPPTFAAALRPNDPRAGLVIDWTKLLHVEQELRHERPMAIGERLRLEARVADAQVKIGRSGTLDFLSVESSAYDADDCLVFVVRSTVAVRR